MKPWKRIEPTTVHTVGWRTVVDKTFIDNKGSQHVFGTYYKEGQEFAAVIALTTDNKVLITRQFRVGPELLYDELPGGFVDPAEDKAIAVKRELLEETGHKAQDIEYLGATHKDGYFNAQWHFFIATGCVKHADQQLEHEEEIEVDMISISQLLENARHDKMSDAVAVYWAQDKLMKLQENA